MSIGRKFISAIGCAFIVSLFLCPGAWAERTVTVALGGDVFHMKAKSAKGGFEGYEIDLMKAVAQEAGFKIKFVEVPWKSLFDGLNEGKYDAVIASVNITAGRKERYELSDPYFSAAQLLVVPRSKVNMKLSGRNVGVFRLSAAADRIRRSGANITYYTVQETPQAFKDLQKGTIDALLCDSPVAIGCTAGSTSSSLCIASLDILDAKECVEEYGIVCRKGNRELVELINKGLASVKAKKLDNEFALRWFKGTAVASTSQGSGSFFASEIQTGPQNSPVSSK